MFLRQVVRKKLTTITIARRATDDGGTSKNLIYGRPGSFAGCGSLMSSMGGHCRIRLNSRKSSVGFAGGAAGKNRPHVERPRAAAAEMESAISSDRRYIGRGLEVYGEWGEKKAARQLRIMCKGMCRMQGTACPCFAFPCLTASAEYVYHEGSCQGNYSILYYIILYYSVLYYIILYSITLYYIVLYSIWVGEHGDSWTDAYVEEPCQGLSSTSVLSQVDSLRLDRGAFMATETVVVSLWYVPRGASRARAPA
jgi:hypothetical protein